MADADAAASFSLEDDSLSAGLSSIAARFEAIAGQINAGFAGANAQLVRTATATQAIGAQAPLIQSLAAGLQLAARSAQMVATGVSGIVLTATRLAPLIKFIPDNFARWVPPLKSAANEFTGMAARIGVVTKGVQALGGRLTALNTLFLGLELRELGASKGMAVLGASATLGFSKMIQGARAAGAGLAGLATQLARMPGRLTGGLGGALGGLGRQIGTVTTIFAPMAGLAMMLGPVGAAAIGVAGAFGVMGKSIKAAGDTQAMQSTFVTLLGSADAAQRRMAELSSFAASTPFEIPQVVQASKILQTLTGGALATGAGLRLVGDAASIAGEPIESLAMHIGRLYDGLMNGRPVGESLMRLQELGLVSAATRGRIEDLQKSGASGANVWTVAAKDLGRFTGEMQRQSATWGGLMSNFGDGVGNVFRALGAPLITAFSPFMVRVNAWLGSIIPLAQRFGQVVAGWSAVASQIFADGKLGQALVLVGKVAFGEAANFLAGAMIGVGNAFTVMLGVGIKNLLTLLSAATTADFWKGLGNALLSAAQAMLAMLFEGTAQVLDQIKGLPGFGKAAKFAANARASADEYAGKSLASGEKAGVQLEPLFRAFGENMSRGMTEVLEAFAKGRANTGNIFDTASDRAAIEKLIQSIMSSAKSEADKLKATLAKGGLPAAPNPNAATDDPAKKDAIGVGALQRIGLGGFAGGGRDPLLATANAQLAEQRKAVAISQQILSAVGARTAGFPLPIPLFQ